MTRREWYNWEGVLTPEQIERLERGEAVALRYDQQWPMKPLPPQPKIVTTQIQSFHIGPTFVRAGGAWVNMQDIVRISPRDGLWLVMTRDWTRRKVKSLEAMWATATTRPGEAP
jgi:hypothetical protein